MNESELVFSIAEDMIIQHQPFNSPQPTLETLKMSPGGLGYHVAFHGMMDDTSTGWPYDDRGDDIKFRLDVLVNSDGLTLRVTPDDPETSTNTAYHNSFTYRELILIGEQR